ncbi:alanine--tRNA ligase, partial [Cooperia oncophora]
RYATEKLNAQPEFFASLVPVVIEILGDTFPELRRDPETVRDIINDEEKQFLKTLVRGRRLFQRAVAGLGTDEKTFPGDVAWRLYDTYGFPADLTQLMAEEKGLTVDQKAFEECRKKAVELESSVIRSILMSMHLLKLQKRGIPTTDDSFKYRYKAEGPNDGTVKYTFETCTGKILAIRCDGKFVDSIEAGVEGALLLDKTNFYAEQGGQIYDTGVLISADDEGTEFVVTNCQVRGGYVVLVGSTNGVLKVGDTVEQVFDGNYPDPVRVVCVGVPVEELLSNPKSGAGLKTTVEFCGGNVRHLHNVGHIGHMVISSEEAIAKGIRRIVALSGPEAERALHRAERLAARTQALSDEIKANTNLAMDSEKFKTTSKQIQELID